MGGDVIKEKGGSSGILKAAAAAVMLGLVGCVLADFSMMKNDYLEGYIETKTGLGNITRSKQDFLIRYQDTLEGDSFMVDGVDKLQEVNISEELFTATSIRLNTEIYSIAANVLSEEFMNQYFAGVDTSIAQTAKEHANPLIFVSLAQGETGTWSDNRYTWIPAVYSKPLSEVVDMDSVHIQDIDSGFYWEHGLEDYFRCDERTSGHQDNCATTLHYPSGGSGVRNDADSLGPLQILRRYVTVNEEARGMSMEEVLSGAEYHINIKNADRTRVLYSVTDLMRWEDNVVWAFNNFMDKVRADSIFKPEHCIETEYELVCMIAVAHNTGASYLVASGTNARPSYWASKDAVYAFCKLAGSPEAIAYISMTYIEPWYEDIRARIQDGRTWSMPGNTLFEGGGSQKDEVMQDILEHLGVEFTGGEDYPLNCAYWRRTSNGGSDHKFRYPMKTLFNYLALKRLYSSGED